MFDNLTIYCLATGKPIAAICEDEVGAIIDSLGHIPVARQAEHLDRVALLSMRPSLLWMSVTPESLDSIRESSPKQLLAYLVNRMYAPLARPTLANRDPDVETMLATRRFRVAMWELIDGADFESKTLDELLVLLLLIDSRFGLSKIEKPQYVTGLWQSWHTVNAKMLIANLTQWHNELSRAAESAARRAKMQSEFWSDGNRMTRLPAQKQFAKVQPSATAIAKREKAVARKHESDFLDQLERELTVRATPQAHDVPTTQPKPVSAVKKPLLRFGVKKDS